VSKGVRVISDEGKQKLRCSIEGIGRDHKDGVDSNQSSRCELSCSPIRIT
jgi:hypothetical protein